MTEDTQDTTQEAAEELAVLMPDRTLEIQGETITIKEFRFDEALALEAAAAPLIAELAAADGSDEVLDHSLVMAAFSNHRAILYQLLQAATGRSTDWIKGLSDVDGHDLLMAFWGVNHGFFVRRVVATILARKASGSGSPKSSPR